MSFADVAVGAATLAILLELRDLGSNENLITATSGSISTLALQRAKSFDSQIGLYSCRVGLGFLYIGFLISAPNTQTPYHSAVQQSLEHNKDMSLGKVYSPLVSRGKFFVTHEMELKRRS